LQDLLYTVFPICQEHFLKNQIYSLGTKPDR
jgi:hypothetical protein